jgi:hypothetical protein
MGSCLVRYNTVRLELMRANGDQTGLFLYVRAFSTLGCRVIEPHSHAFS